MNGNRNHLPEVAFVTWLKRHLGKKRYFHCLGKTRSLYALPEHIHSQLSRIFTQTLWSTLAKSFTPCGWCNLQFGFIRCAQESKDTTARLLLAPNVSPAPSPTPPGLGVKRTSCKNRFSALWRSTLCPGHLAAKPNICFVPPGLSQSKGVTTQRGSLYFGHCFETGHSTQYYQPHIFKLESDPKTNNNSLEIFWLKKKKN